MNGLARGDFALLDPTHQIPRALVRVSNLLDTGVKEDARGGFNRLPKVTRRFLRGILRTEDVLDQASDIPLLKAEANCSS